MSTPEETPAPAPTDQPVPEPETAPAAGDATSDEVATNATQISDLADAVYALALGLGPALENGGADGKNLHQILKTKVNALNPSRFTFDPPNPDF